MIDDYNADRTGWARFSDNRKLRYRLARSLTGEPLVVENDIVQSAKRCVFLMLNPSTADAFKLDPTNQRCLSFAKKWKFRVMEVVNIFALRSTDPLGLRKPRAVLGHDAINDEQIMFACRGADRVVAAWGNHGLWCERGAQVHQMLRAEGIALCAFTITKQGQPNHPLYIPLAARIKRWR
ncbi:MAG TPA: DUF1643 domain-containing protein [Kofleriaceae bacterium]|jgi:hypothetical protein